MAEGMKHQDRDSGRCLSPDRSHACCNIIGGITRSANGRSARHGAASNTPVDINVERALLSIAAPTKLPMAEKAANDGCSVGLKSQRHLPQPRARPSEETPTLAR